MAIRFKDDESFTLDLTPMIDVVFLLIIFFLVATTFQELEREVDVDVPESDAGSDGGDASETFVVNVLEDGRIVVSGRTVTGDELAALIERAVEEESDTKAVVRAHGRLAWEQVVDVHRICWKVTPNVAFATLPMSTANAGTGDAR